MPQDHDDLSPAVGQSAPTSAGFDRAFTAVAASPGIRRVWAGENCAATTFTSMVELGRSKGYTPVCHTGNLFFVRDDLAGHVGPLPADPDELFIRDWINPTPLRVWRRKLRWLTPQRVLCKAEETFANLSLRG